VLWLNFVAYQLVWFVAVIGAGRGLFWPGVIAALLFAAWELRSALDRSRRLQLLAVALVVGTAVDGALVASGWLRYAADSPVLPGGAPLWIVTLWGAFSLTLTRSLAWLLKHPLLAALLGGIGAPFAYLGAGRGWDAVRFTEPIWQALSLLGIGWAMAMLLFTFLAKRWAPVSRV
jgi:hypothetical protein